MKLKNQNLQHLGFIALAGISPFALQSAQATNLYWDTNGATAGAGVTANGTWSATTSGFWSTDSTGASATSNYNVANSGSPSTADVFFSAGTDATTTNVTLSGAVVANSITVEELLNITSATTTPSLTLGAGGLTIASGALSSSTWINTLPLTLSASQSWTTAGSSGITVNGSTTAGSSNMTFTRAGAGAGVVSLAGGLTFNSTSGTTFATSGTTAANTSIGAITFASGTSAMTSSGTAFTLAGDITNNSGVLQTINNAITLTTASRTFTAGSGGLALGGNFSGATNNLTFVGAGTTTLSGTNTFNTNQGNFSGFFVGGTIASGSSSAGNVSITGATEVNGSGASSSSGGYIEVRGGSTLTIQTGGSLAINAVTTNAQASLIGQNSTGTGTLLVNGGTLTVSGAQGFVIGNNRSDATGVLTISSGTATINSGSATATDARSFISLGRDLANGTINLNGGTLATDRNFVRDGSNGGGANGGTANFVFGGGTLKALANQTDWLNSALINTYQQALSSVTTTSTASTVDSNGFTVAIKSAISGAGGFNIISSSGTGTVTLGGANSYTGATTIKSGTLSVASLNSVSGGTATSNLGAPVTVANGTIAIGATTTTGTLLINSGSTGQTTDRVINLAGTTGGATIDQSGTGLLKFTSDFTATGVGAKTLTLQGSTAGTGEIAGKIVDSSSGATSVTKAGTSTWTLSGANTYTGATTVSAGTLTLSNALALQNSALDTTNSIAGTSTAGLKTTVTTLTMGGLTGNKNLASVFTTTSGGYSGVTALTLNPGTGVTNAYSGVIANGAAGMTLTKTGLGTQTLSGANTYTGATTVSAGKLVVGVGGAGSVTSNVSVASAATLGGSGTITGNVSLAAESSGGAKNGGTLAAGNSPGTLTVTGTTTFNTGSIFSWDIDSSLSQTAGTGYDSVKTPTLSGAAAVFQVVLQGSDTFASTFWSSDHFWTNIFSTAGTSATALNLSSIFSSFTYSNGGGTLTDPSGARAFHFIDGTGGGATGSTLTWSAVPEPTSALAGLLIGAGLLRRRRIN